jgi:hypothetical protein
MPTYISFKDELTRTMVTIRRADFVPQSKDDVLSPGERGAVLAVRLAVYAVLVLILSEAMDALARYVPGSHPTTLFWVVRTCIFLPLHEGGHFLFMFFGKTLYILGGSFWQIVFPLIWFIIALKQRSQIAPFPLFWTGENMMDVSLYMRDAPMRILPLLGGHASGHDWWNLFTMWGIMDSAEDIADVMYVSGLGICIVSIMAGMTWAVVSYRKDTMIKRPVFSSA